MAVPTKPTLVSAFGNESWGFVLTVANIQLPSVAELNAATGFNLSCSVFGEQEGVSATTEKVTLPRLLCETDTFEVNGSTTHAMADLMVSFNPQGAAASVGKKAWETLVSGATGFLWRRQGIAGTTDLVIGQFVDIIPTQLGTRIPTKTGAGADGVFAFTVPASITSTPAYNKALVA